MKVWVTRDRDFDSIKVWTGDKPLKQNGGYYGRNGDCHLIRCSFKRIQKILMSYAPRKGSCKKYELTLTEVK